MWSWGAKPFLDGNSDLGSRSFAISRTVKVFVTMPFLCKKLTKPTSQQLKEEEARNVLCHRCFTHFVFKSGKSSTETYSQRRTGSALLLRQRTGTQQYHSRSKAPRSAALREPPKAARERPSAPTAAPAQQPRPRAAPTPTPAANNNSAARPHR